MNKKQIGVFKTFATVILLIVSWLSIGIGFAEPLDNPLLSNFLFLGGLILFGLSLAFLIRQIVKSFRSL